MLTFQGQFSQLWHSTFVLKDTKYDTAFHQFYIHAFLFLKVVMTAKIQLLTSLHILQLKVDKIKLVELSGSSESEFSSVSYCISMLMLIFFSFSNKERKSCISFFQNYSNMKMLFQVSTSMKDLCFDVFGISKEKKNPTEVKGNRGNIGYFLILHLLIMFFFLLYVQPFIYLYAELLDALPEKRRFEDGGYASDEGHEVIIHISMTIYSLYVL